MNNETYCGLIAIVGRPNVGKSTLMNQLIGQKLSITSRKPQTTQYKINGVLTSNNHQFIFVDTPGFQKRYVNKLNDLLNQSVINSLKDVDVVLYVVEAGVFNEADLAVLKLIPPTTKTILVVNKQDRLKPQALLSKFVNEVETHANFAKSYSVCAKHHVGIMDLITGVEGYLPQGPFLYSEDQLTDRPNRFLASEIIREKLFRHLGQELPYSLTVEINEYKVEKNLVRIDATILVEKANQKPMIIGNSGEKLKKISSEARLDMEKLFGSKVFLQTWVKVRTGFLHDPKFLDKFV